MQYSILYCIIFAHLKKLFNLKTVYGDHAVTLRSVYEWFRRFREGWKTVEDAHRTGRPTTTRMLENVDNVKNLFASDRRLAVRMIVEEVGNLL